MKKILTFFACTIICISAFAQSNAVYSENSFNEPVNGWNKIIFLKNGNTVYINGNASNFRIMIYDKDHKSISNQNIPYRSAVQGGMQGTDPILKAVYEVQDNIVILMSCNTGCGMGGYVNCVQNLYRFVLDPATGKVTKGDKICETEKVRSWGYNLSTMTYNDIYVTKDPVSDMYAVLVFNGYTEDMPDRVKLMTFDGNHQMVKTVVLDALSTKDRAVHFAGICMYDKVVYLGTNMRNAKEKGQEVPLCISVLRDGADVFTTTVLNIKPFAINSDCKMAYNPATKTLDLLITTETSKKNTGGFFSDGSESTQYLTSGIIKLDAATMTTKYMGGIDGTLVDVYAKEKLGEKDGFNGVMPSYYLHADKSPVIVQEEQHVVTRSGYGSGVTATMVSKIGVTKLGTDSKATSGYVLRIREISANLYRMHAPEAYYDYQYLSTPSADYLIFNDLEENVDKPEKAKPHALLTISDANTVVCKMINGKIEKSYAWGAPQKRNDDHYAMVGVSAFDETTHTWATILVNGDDKRARLAWLKLD